MVTIRAGKVAMGVCLLLLAAGCSREQQDWRSAEAADSIAAYDQFIQRHPESELATQARTRIAQLGEDQDWQLAGSDDTPEAYRQFITQHPNGKWTQEARIRIENFSLGAEPADGPEAASVPPAVASAAGRGAGGPTRAGTAEPAVGGRAVPGEAAQSARHISPAGSAQPVSPTQPISPAQRASPTQPISPAQRVSPTQAGSPTQAVSPAQPVSSTQAVSPTQRPGPAQAPGAGRAAGAARRADAGQVAGPATTAASASTASASSAASGGRAGYGIQLGAFSSEASANSEWKALTGRFGPELQGLSEHVVSADTPSGRLYRLQAAVPDEARARALCEALKKRSQGCVLVLPH